MSISRALQMTHRYGYADGGDVSDSVSPDDDAVTSALDMSDPSNGAVMRAYDPSWRDRIGAYLFDQTSGSPEARRFVSGMVGSTGLGDTGMSVSDLTPVGQVLAAQDAARHGDYKGAAMAALPLPPVIGPEARAAGNVIRAYHGSPYDFDRFDLSKIGTGEGAQAYGHGLYFAENPTVAQGYRDTLSPYTVSLGGKKITPQKGSPEELAQQYLDDAIRLKSSDPMSSAISRMMIAKENNRGADKFVAAEQILRDWDAMGAEPTTGGRMYEVNIHADPEHFLDWDKPLSEQNENVQRTIRKAGVDAPDWVQGSDLYDYIGNHVGGDYDALADASSFLLKNKVPGIKYLDQGSRAITVQPMYKGQPYGEPLKAPDRAAAEVIAQHYKDKGFDANILQDGSRNYVVFDDKIIEIARKYGIPISSAAALYGAMNQNGSPEQPPHMASGGSVVDRALALSQPDSSIQANGKTFSPDDVQAILTALSKRGVGHDSLIAQINPHEAALLKQHGGSGKINPRTGLLSFDDGGGGGDGGGDSGDGGSGDDGSGDNGGGSDTGGGGNGSGEGEGGLGSLDGGDEVASEDTANQDAVTAALGQTDYGSFGLSGPVGGIGAATGLGPGATDEENLALNPDAITAPATLAPASLTSADLVANSVAPTSFSAPNAGSTYGDLNNVNFSPVNPSDYAYEDMASVPALGQTGWGAFGPSGPTGVDINSGAALTGIGAQAASLGVPGAPSAANSDDWELGPVSVQTGERPGDIAPEYADIPSLTIHGSAPADFNPDSTILGPVQAPASPVEIVTMTPDQIAQTFPTPSVPEPTEQQPSQPTATPTSAPAGAVGTAGAPSSTTDAVDAALAATNPQSVPDASSYGGLPSSVGVQSPSISPTSFADVTPGASGPVSTVPAANPAASTPAATPAIWADTGSWTSPASVAAAQDQQQAQVAASRQAAIARAQAAARTSNYQGRAYSPQVLATPIPTQHGMQQQTIADQISMARAILGEGRNQDRQGQVAIAQSIANRAAAQARTGASIRGSAGSQANAPSQYSWHIPGGDRTGSNRAAVAAAERSNSPAWQQAMDISRGVISGQIEDPTHGATFYHTSAIHPAWASARGMSRTATIGPHQFYSYAPWHSVRSRVQSIPNIGDGLDQGHPVPPANIPNVGPRASVESPSAVDKALAFLSMFNPIGSAHAEEAKFGAPAWVGGSPQQAWDVAKGYNARANAATKSGPAPGWVGGSPAQAWAVARGYQDRVDAANAKPSEALPFAPVEHHSSNVSHGTPSQAAIDHALALSALEHSGGYETWWKPPVVPVVQPKDAATINKAA